MEKGKYEKSLGSGKYVETPVGPGKTKNSDKPEKGKILVYLDSGVKMLCRPDNIKIVGFYD